MSATNPLRDFQVPESSKPKQPVFSAVLVPTPTISFYIPNPLKNIKNLSILYLKYKYGNKF